MTSPGTDAQNSDDFYLTRLLSKIRAERGLDLSGFRRTYVMRRIDTRLLSTGSENMREYIRRLDQDPAEWDELMNALTVNVSDFFRDPTVYRYLAEVVVPELVDAKDGKHHQSVRVWSAGCSNGQEPYSVAMLFADELARRGSDVRLAVAATDIDPQVLVTAKAGRYPKQVLRTIPPHLRRRYVVSDATGFEIVPELRSMVHFRRLDLFADNPIGAVDLIMCRNVMIYFDRAKQRDVHTKFARALRKGGFLVIGKSEKLAPELAARLLPRNIRERVYQAAG